MNGRVRLREGGWLPLLLNGPMFPNLFLLYKYGVSQTGDAILPSGPPAQATKRKPWPEPEFLCHRSSWKGSSCS